MFEIIRILNEGMIQIVKNIHLLTKIVDDLLDFFHLLFTHIIKLRVQARLAPKAEKTNHNFKTHPIVQYDLKRKAGTLTSGWPA